MHEKITISKFVHIMASFNLELRKDVLANGKQAIALRVQIKGDVKRKNTGFSVYEKEWDFTKGKVKRSHPNYTELNDSLHALAEKAEKVYARLSKNTVHVSSKAVLSAVFMSNSFVTYIKKQYDELIKDPKKSSTAKKYNTMIVLINAFDPGIAIEAIDGPWLKAFRESRKKAGMAHNTIVSNLSVIRTIYKSAIIDLRFKPEVFPFDEITIGDSRSANKEPLNSEEIERLHKFDGTSRQNLVRDIWLTSYYLAGLRFGDVLRLKWTDIQDNRVSVQPNKTENSSGKILNMIIVDQLAQIFSKYDTSTETIFNVIKTGYPREVDVVNRSMSPTLKLVLLGAGIAKNVGFSNARNSFAQAAKKKQPKEKETIKDALGHTKIKTTEIYLGNNTDAIDELMQKVYKKD